jgi:hypothetical protein
MDIVRLFLEEKKSNVYPPERIEQDGIKPVKRGVKMKLLDEKGDIALTRFYDTPPAVPKQ